MIVELTSLIILLVSAGLAARWVVRRLGLGATSERLPAMIAFGTVGIAWCLVCAHVPALVAELSDVAIVRMPVIAVVSVAGLVVLRVLGPGRHHKQPEPAVAKRSSVRRWWRHLSPGTRWACVLPVALLHGFLLIDGVLTPPTDCDTLVYHLPTVARWLQTGRLAMVDGVEFFNLPANCELWQMFFVSTRIEPLIRLSLVPVGVLLAMIVAGSSRELGAPPAGALMTALLALTCPLIALQMYSSYVDMFATTFVVGGFYWLMRLWRRGLIEGKPVASLALAGLNVGIAMGAKLTILPWAAGIGLGVLVLLILKPGLRAAGRDAEGRPLAAGALAFALAAATGSGFWYFRSVYYTGWPFHPVQLEIAGRVVGTGLPRAMHDLSLYWEDRGLARLLIYPWLEWKHSGYPYSADSGLGVGFVTFAVPGLVYLALRRRWWARPSEVWLDRLVWVFVIGGMALFLTIFRPATRYILPTWTIMFAASGPLLGLLLRAFPRGSVVLAGTAIALSAAMIGLKPAHMLAGRLRDRDLSRAHAYEIPELFDRLPRGTIVLNLGPAAKTYPLLGARLQNEVIDRTLWSMGNQRRLQPPVSQAQLDTHGIEIVYTRRRVHAPFTHDVAYEVIYDDMARSDRLPTSSVTRVYRVLRDRPSSERSF